jgi:hypothetical protein
MEANQADAYPAEPLYAAAKRIYPQSVKGAFQRIKWILLVVTWGAYYLLPFLRWQRGSQRSNAGDIGRFSASPLLFLFHRNLAPGSLSVFGELPSNASMPIAFTIKDSSGWQAAAKDFFKGP